MFVKTYSTIQVVFASAISIVVCNVVAIVAAVYALPVIGKFLFF